MNIVSLLLVTFSLLGNEYIALATTQKEEEAIRLFLEMAPRPSEEKHPSETALYREAWATYLEEPLEEARLSSEQRISKYAPLLEAEPADSLLRLLVGSAYANVGDWSGFYRQVTPFFEEGYSHPLLDKIRAVLYIRLFHLGKTMEERDSARCKAILYLDKSFSMNPIDFKILRMEFSLLNNQEKKKRISEFLRKIRTLPTLPPKSDLFFFINEGRRYSETEELPRLIEKAVRQYPESRALSNEYKE